MQLLLFCLILFHTASKVFPVLPQGSHLLGKSHHFETLFLSHYSMQHLHLRRSLC